MKPSQAALSLGIIGGGPAGLKAAEIALEQGAAVTLYDAKPSVGRKFLIAGKSGLNLSNAEKLSRFEQRYSGASQPPHIWRNLLQDFDNEDVRSWTQSLGISTFISSGKKIFPEQMKAAPLLRRWLEKIKQQGATLAMRHELHALFFTKNQVQLEFKTPEGIKTQCHDRVILALGGASWKQTGSTGAWVNLLQALGIKIEALSPANVGWEINWSKELIKEAAGKPIKNIQISSGDASLLGEIMLTSYGVEGGPIYRLGPQIRQHKQLKLDLKPSHSAEQLLKKMESVKRGYLEQAKHRWKLADASYALLKHHHRAANLDLSSLVKLVKNCGLALEQPRPLEEAISTAGGVLWSELTDDLQVKKYPALFLAGEMLDWEAPTGGFLLQGCLATGKRAALSATRL